ncbi:hypothetical protein Tco_0773747 [Tanacetum coccineum]|uniref:Reverse transcriptase domain-containing protein n=1 Tax=Tanacetum coccineum TaxID=301880 RepID=A0ABQ4ZP56_9ASTR
MSDSKHSTITYTSVSIPVEEDSDMGSPGFEWTPSRGLLKYVAWPEEPEQHHPHPYYFTMYQSLLSRRYIPESDPERDPEEDDEEDPEKDPADYPADRRGDDDDDDEDEDEKEEEEHLAPADYTVVALPTVDHVPSEEETEPFETDECATTPPSPLSPLIPYSSPLPQIPSPPLPIPSPPPNSPTHIEVPKSCLPLRKRLRLAAPTPNHEVGESSAADAARQDGPAIAREDPYSLDYGITDTWDDLVGAIEEITLTTLEGVNQWVTNLSTTIEQETTIMYGMIEDAQDDQSLLRARVKLLYRDRPVHRVQLTKALELLKGLQTQMTEFQRQHRPAKALLSILVLLSSTAILSGSRRKREATRNGSGTGARRHVQVARECTYPNFLKCQPLNFKGTEGVIGLTQWFEKMESVYSISNYTVACQVKFTTCTVQGNALTWWNSHVKTTTPEAAHANYAMEDTEKD